MCGEHKKLHYHANAMVAYENFLTTSQNPEKNIQAQIESKQRNTILRNREIITSVVKCIHFCGKQSIALRGHREDSNTDERLNKGNFLALLEFRIDTGDEPLKKHLETCHTNARSSSKTIQNQIISLIGEYIRESIVHEIKEANFF